MNLTADQIGMTNAAIVADVREYARSLGLSDADAAAAMVAAELVVPKFTAVLGATMTACGKGDASMREIGLFARLFAHALGRTVERCFDLVPAETGARS